VFLAERNAALDASRMVAAKPLPDGLSIWATSNDPESKQVKDAQAMMATAGLVPISG
jgi:hypothetical protein